MATRPTTESQPTPQAGLTTNTVYFIVAVSLLLGFLMGYFVVGKSVKSSVAATAPTGRPGPMMGNHPKLTLEQMKQMADVQASALLEKSKKEPKNSALLIQIAGIYEMTHQFKQAAGYYQDALKLDPKNVTARTAMASCLYYSGDVDGALAQLDQSLKINPKDPNSLFNLGMIKYQGKKDTAGAIAVWEQLLKSNPNLDRKPIVEQMIAEAEAKAKTSSSAEPAGDIKN